MREHRWITKESVPLSGAVSVCRRLASRGLAIRDVDDVTACYVDELRVDRIEDVRRLDPWPIDELTLIEVLEPWDGDFYVVAGLHHEIFRSHGSDEAYLSICHPWRVPFPDRPTLHHRDAFCWVGFRSTHGFLRVRVVPREIVTPGEGIADERGAEFRTERALAFRSAITTMDLPLTIEAPGLLPVVSGSQTGIRVAGSWPDGFGPCQFEYVVPDRYDVLVPAAGLVAEFGPRPSVLRTFLSGWDMDALRAFRTLQPTARLMYRGFIHASLGDLPSVVAAVAPSGRALVTVGEFSTSDLLPEGKNAYAVVGVIGDDSGYVFEVRLSRMPLEIGATEAWIEQLIGVPVQYTPLPVL